MNITSRPISLWMLDSSTFIHCLFIDRIPLLIDLRKPIFFPEYVLRYELGINARPQTRDEAKKWTGTGKIGVKNLTLADLERIAASSAPRKIGLGELACALVAEREIGGILCDDRQAQKWILANIPVHNWECIEDFLLEAAADYHLNEHDLRKHQDVLTANRYTCRFPDLQLEFLYRRANATPRT
jgi:hypothetical protein